MLLLDKMDLSFIILEMMSTILELRSTKISETHVFLPNKIVHVENSALLSLLLKYS